MCPRIKTTYYFFFVIKLEFTRYNLCFRRIFIFTFVMSCASRSLLGQVSLVSSGMVLLGPQQSSFKHTTSEVRARNTANKGGALSLIKLSLWIFKLISILEEMVLT